MRVSYGWGFCVLFMEGAMGQAQERPPKPVRVTSSYSGNTEPKPSPAQGPALSSAIKLIGARLELTGKNDDGTRGVIYVAGTGLTTGMQLAVTGAGLRADPAAF